MAGGSVRARAFTRANLIAGIMLTATSPRVGANLADQTDDDGGAIRSR